MLFASRGRKVGLAIFDRWHKGLTQGLVCYLSPAITGPTGLQLLDLSGQNNHGTLTNMDAPTDWVLDRHGYAIDFDGTNDRVLLANVPALQITGPITIAFWANLKNNGAVSALISKSDGFVGEYEVFANFTSGATTLSWRPGTGSNLTSFFSGFTDAWHHFAFTCTGSVIGSTVTCYRNGVSAGTMSTSSARSTGTLVPAIASRPNGSNHSQVRMADVSIHNRVLTPSEVAALSQLAPGSLGRPLRANYFPLETAIAYALSAAVANYTLTGGPIPLLYGRAIPADTAAILMQGQSTLLLLSRLLGADRGNYDVSGLDAGILLGRLLDAGATAYTVNGTSAGFLASRRISAESVAHLASGQDAAFLRSRVLQAGTGQYILVASPIDIQTGTGGAAPYYYLFLLGGSC